MDAAVDFALQQAGGLQHAEVLGDGGERDLEGPGDLGDGGFALGEAGENGAAGGVRQGPEDGVEGRAEIVNHVV